MELNDIPKTDKPFVPPTPSYFGNLPDRILTRAQTKESASGFVQYYSKYGLRVAAALAVLILAIWIMRPLALTEETAQEMLAGVPAHTIQSYLLTASDMSHEELLEVATEQGIPVQDIGILPEDADALEQEVLEWEELEDYL